MEMKGSRLYVRNLVLGDSKLKWRSVFRYIVEVKKFKLDLRGEKLPSGFVSRSLLLTLKYTREIRETREWFHVKNSLKNCDVLIVKSI